MVNLWGTYNCEKSEKGLGALFFIIPSLDFVKNEYNSFEFLENFSCSPYADLRVGRRSPTRVIEHMQYEFH